MEERTAKWGEGEGWQGGQKEDDGGRVAHSLLIRTPSIFCIFSRYPSPFSSGRQRLVLDISKLDG